jgi:hypothetical protein
MKNWVELIFCQRINIVMMLWQANFETNPIHSFQEKHKMVLGDGGSFLEKDGLFLLGIHWICSSYSNACPLQISQRMDARFERYGHSLVLRPT